MNATDPIRRSTDIHRLLDEAFVGVVMTPEMQDLKEEIRDNLLFRVAELEASGVEPSDAARRAVAELGDIRALVDGGADAPAPVHVSRRRRPPCATGCGRSRPSWCAPCCCRSCRPLRSCCSCSGSSTCCRSAPGCWSGSRPCSGSRSGSSRRMRCAQETSSSHPLPTGRAVAFGASTGVLLAGLAFTAVVIVRLDLAWIILLGAAHGGRDRRAELARRQADEAARAFAGEQRRAMRTGNRFEEDPASAARFGIYTAAIWTVAFVVAVILGFTVGWLWALVALIGGFVVMLITLARMLFGADSSKKG